MDEGIGKNMFQIGELAKRCGVTADTLRFYEKNNLIAPASRSESGYRLYDENNQKMEIPNRVGERIGFRRPKFGRKVHSVP